MVGDTMRFRYYVTPNIVDNFILKQSKHNNPWLVYWLLNARGRQCDGEAFSIHVIWTSYSCETKYLFTWIS